MSAHRPSRDPVRLLRWYPRSWRERHGAVLLGTFHEQGTGREAVTLSRGDAWSMRTHGLAERLSPAAGAGLALAGVLVMLVGLVGFFTAPDSPSAASWAATVLLVGLGPALTSLAAVALARDLGLTTALGTVVGAAASVVAWSAATLATLSWGVGFSQADDGVALGTFARAFPFLLLGAVAVGAVALSPAIAGALRAVRSSSGRWALASACAVAGALIIGVSVLAPGSALLGGLVVLVACGLRWVPGRDSRRGTRRAAPVDATPTRPQRRAVLALAATSAVLTLPCALYALLGEPGTFDVRWFPAAVDPLPAMNAGLALGSVASLPLVLAAGLATTRWWGRRAYLAAALLAVAVVLRGVSAAQGPAGDTGTQVLVVAAVLAGLAVVVPFEPRVPLRPAARWALVAVVGLAAGWVVGLPVVAVLPLAAPVAAVVLVVVTARGPRKRPETAGPHRPQVAVG